MIHARGSLERLAALYATVERMRSLELVAAARAMEEASGALMGQCSRIQSEACLGRAALAEGDREAWLLAEAAREFAGLKLVRLRAAEEQSEAAHAEAVDVHRESLMQAEQAETLLEEQASRTAMEQARLTQAASDDRFLARRTYAAARMK